MIKAFNLFNLLARCMYIFIFQVFHHRSAHTAGKAVQGSGYFVLETQAERKL